MTLATKTLVGMGLGLVAGLVFGERVAFLKVFGDIFIALLQMTVLPYVFVSLIADVGQLKSSQAASLAKSIGLTLLGLWALTLGANLTLPLAFPNWEQASFYSTSLVAEAPAFDIIEQYIPVNVFRSLSSNIVPSVVVFCLALGGILIGIPQSEKATLLSVLNALSAGLLKLSGSLAKLSPYGVFAIVAAVCATLQPDEFEFLQLYIAAYIVVSVILAFWTLPALVAAVAPVSYGDVFRYSRDALVTAFATGSLFVVVPILAKGAKDLLEQTNEGKSSGSSVDMAIASSISLPTSGKLLALTYVLFAGWLASTPLQVTDYPLFLITGLLSFFGSIYHSIPYLLDLFRIPSDTFQYFPAVNNLVCARFGTLVAAVHTMVLAVLAGAVAAGTITLKARKIVPYVIITVLLSLSGPLLVRVVFENFLEKEYAGYKLFIDMDLLEPGDSRHFSTTLPPAQPRPTGTSRLDWVRETGRLRVGYLSDSLPFAHVNSGNELVGFDVEMAHSLGRDLGVQIHFVRVTAGQVQQHLKNGVIDLVMSGLEVTPERAADYDFTTPYIDKTMAFLVRDHRRTEFNSREAVQSLEAPRIGVIDSPYLKGILKRYLPTADLVTYNSPREFLRENLVELDAFLFSAEAGSAWTLVYPRFTVVVPRPDVLSLPVAYATEYGDQSFIEFLNTWIALKKKDGTTQRFYSYWIEGKMQKEPAPVWSLIDYLSGESAEEVGPAE